MSHAPISVRVLALHRPSGLGLLARVEAEVARGGGGGKAAADTLADARAQLTAAIEVDPTLVVGLALSELCFLCFPNYKATWYSQGGKRLSP